MARRRSLTVVPVEESDVEPEGCQYLLHSRRRRSSLTSTGDTPVGRSVSKASACSRASDDDTATPRCSAPATARTLTISTGGGIVAARSLSKASASSSRSPRPPPLANYPSRSATLGTMPPASPENGKLRGSLHEAVERSRTSMAPELPPIASASPQQPPERQPQAQEALATAPSRSSTPPSVEFVSEEASGIRPNAAVAAREFREGQQRLDQNVDFMLTRIGAGSPPPAKEAEEAPEPPREKPKKKEEEPPSPPETPPGQRDGFRYGTAMGRVRLKIMALTRLKNDLG